MLRLLIGLLAVAMMAAAPVGAQSPDAQAYSQEELDQLLAPIALYPDQLLMQVLIAATYPIEVIDAARFVQQNPDLRADALDEALAGKSWDPSVKSLAAFPPVLAMMNDKLDWMHRLGDAFLVDQSRVMDTVQALRRRAEAAGNLQTTPQQTVLTQGGEIYIEAGQPDVVYVPAYNPYTIYGPWWAPDYPPWFWYPPAIYGYPVGVGIAAGIFYGTAWGISHSHWNWVRPDWRGHHVNLHPGGNRFWDHPGRPAPPPGGTWRHEPEHRRGVAYPNLATYDRYRSANPDAVRQRQEFRGRERAQPLPNDPRPGSYAARPSPGGAPATPRAIEPRPAPHVAQPHARPTAPGFDPGVSRQQAQSNAARGQQSRQSGGSVAAPGFRAPAAPSGSRAPSSAPAPRGGVQKRP